MATQTNRSERRVAAPVKSDALSLHRASVKMNADDAICQRKRIKMDGGNKLEIFRQGTPVWLESLTSDVYEEGMITGAAVRQSPLQIKQEGEHVSSAVFYSVLAGKTEHHYVESKRIADRRVPQYQGADKQEAISTKQRSLVTKKDEPPAADDSSPQKFLVQPMTTPLESESLCALKQDKENTDFIQSSDETIRSEVEQDGLFSPIRRDIKTVSEQGDQCENAEPVSPLRRNCTFADLSQLKESFFTSDDPNIKYGVELDEDTFLTAEEVHKIVREIQRSQRRKRKASGLDKKAVAGSKNGQNKQIGTTANHTSAHARAKDRPLKDPNVGGKTPCSSRVQVADCQDCRPGILRAPRNFKDSHHRARQGNKKVRFCQLPDRGEAQQPRHTGSKTPKLDDPSLRPPKRCGTEQPRCSGPKRSRFEEKSCAPERPKAAPQARYIGPERTNLVAADAPQPCKRRNVPVGSHHKPTKQRGIQFVLPGEFGKDFLMRTILGENGIRKRELCDAFGCTMEFKGTMIDGSPASNSSAPRLYIQVKGCNERKLLNCCLSIEHLLAMAVPKIFQGYLLYTLAVLNRFLHGYRSRGANGIVQIKSLDHFASSNGNGPVRFVAAIRVFGPPINGKHCATFKQQVQREYPSCFIQLVERDSSHREVLPHILLSSSSYNDVLSIRAIWEQSGQR